MYDSSFYTIVVRARIASDTPSQADRIENDRLSKAPEPASYSKRVDRYPCVQLSAHVLVLYLHSTQQANR